MIVLGFILAVITTGPVFFTLGIFANGDRRVTHEPADISAALKRSVKRSVK